MYTQHQFRDRSRHGSAFTLIELLVVVAIIALLISILLPSLSRARAQARSVKCSSILKEIGVADQFYQTEYGTHMPYTVPSPRPQDGGEGYHRWWNNRLFRRSMSLPVDQDAFRYAPSGLICPNAGYSLNNPGGNGLYGMQHSQVMNVTWGGSTGGMDGDTNTNIGHRREEIVKSWHPSSVNGPSSKIFMSDGTKSKSTYGNLHAYISNGETLGGFAPTAYRHFYNGQTQQGTANVLFFDLHVQAMRYPDELTPRDQWYPYE